ncbi:MAG: hypothetical protein ACLT98_03495 [Eggerthellaceae bacterium]
MLDESGYVIARGLVRYDAGMMRERTALLSTAETIVFGKGFERASRSFSRAAAIPAVRIARSHGDAEALFGKEGSTWRI